MDPTQVEAALDTIVNRLSTLKRKVTFVAAFSQSDLGGVSSQDTHIRSCISITLVSS